MTRQIRQNTARLVAACCGAIGAMVPPVAAETTYPYLQASIGDANSDGIGDHFNQATPWLIRRVGVEDRAIAEYDLRPYFFAGAVNTAQLHVAIANNNSAGSWPRRFEVALFAGNAQADLSDFSAPALVVLGEIVWASPQAPAPNVTYIITQQLAQLYQSGVGILGVRVRPVSDNMSPSVFQPGPLIHFGFIDSDCDNDGLPDETEISPRLDFGLLPTVDYSAMFSTAATLANVRDGYGRDLVAISLNDSISVVTLGWNVPGRYFAMPEQYPVGNRPVAVVELDQSGAGRSNIAVMCRDDNTIHFLRNGTPQGELFPGTVRAYSLGWPLRSMAYERLNGDSPKDLAILTDGGVYLEYGTGVGEFNFTPWGEGVVAVGSAPVAILAAAITGPDLFRMDLLVVNSGSNSVSQLRNRGDGTFDPPVNYAVGTSPRAVLHIDLNGDGIGDFATANLASDDITIWFGDGAGGFANPRTVAVCDSPVSLSANYIDDEGGLDLAVAGTRSMYSVLLNDGAANFDRSDYPTAAGASSVFAVDLQLGSRPEIVVNSASSIVCTHRGDGVGGFSGGATPLIHQSGYFALKKADILGDVREELIAASGSAPIVTIFEQNGAALDPIASASLPEPAFDMAIGDIDRDADLDIVVACIDLGGVVTLRNDGGSFASTQYAIAEDVADVALLDYDQDGDLDVAAVWPGVYDNGCHCYSAGEISRLTNDGAGNFTTISGFTTVSGAVCIATGDFNRDGRTDLVTGGVDSAQLAVHPGQGGGAFGPATLINYAANVYDVSVGDLNRDRRDDIVAGRFVNFDFVPDGVGVVLASEFGGFHTVQTYSQMCPPKLTLADLNGDGFVEIIGGNILTDDVGVLENRRDGTFALSRNFLAADGVSAVETLDLDGDGQLDLVAAGYTLGGAIVGLINETPPPSELDCNHNGLPDSCDILAGTADANANGVPDECEFHCPGDLDGNDQVGLSDLTILLANFGTTEGATSEQGDSNGDGDVDLGDLTVLLGAFGSTCP